jgi:signal transduction histidine kinase
MKRILVFILACFLAVGFAYAAERGTAKEAQAMVGKAASLLKASGKDVAFAEFNMNPGKFVDKDLYVFVLDAKGTTLAHGGNKALIGKTMLGLRDSEGKYFIKAVIDEGNKKGSGWVDYKWSNPTTKKIESKSTYVQKAGDFYIGCGIYK